MTSDGGLLQDVDAAGRAEPDHVGQTDLGLGDLAVAGLAPEVVADLPDVGDAGGGDRVALRLQTARRCCSDDSVRSFSPLPTTAAAAPSQLAEHIDRVLG